MSRVGAVNVESGRAESQEKEGEREENEAKSRSMLRWAEGIAVSPACPPVLLGAELVAGG